MLQVSLAASAQISHKIENSDIKRVITNFEIKNTSAQILEGYVSTGIPLASTSMISDTRVLSIIDDTNNIMKFSITPVSYWDNEHSRLKWIRLHVNTRQTSGSSKTLKLIELKNKTTSTGSMLLDSGDNFMIKNTAYNFKINKHGTMDVYAANQKLLMTEQDVLDSVPITTMASQIKVLINDVNYARIKTERIVYEKDKCKLTVVRHYDFYRNSDVVKVMHTLRNSEENNDRDFTSQAKKQCLFKSFDVNLHRIAAVNKQKVTLHEEGKTVATDLTGLINEVTIYQDSSGKETWNVPGGPYSFRGYEIRENGKRTHGGHHASGMMRVEYDDFDTSVSLRHFWQNNPKSLVANTKSGISVELWPKEFARSHWFFGGYQKTHEMFYSFNRMGQSANEQFSFADERLFIQLPPAYLIETGVFGLTAVENRKLFADYERLISSQINPDEGDRIRSIFINNIDKRNVYGTDYFGDTDQETGEWNWQKRQMSNLEEDTTWGMLLAYARKGNIDFLRTAIPMARHIYDIDINHANSGIDLDRKYQGANRKHGAFNIDNGAELTHVWLQGLLTYYYLSGEEQAFEGAREIADNVVYRINNNRDAALTESRIPGWSIKALLQFYEATHEKKYLDAAIRMKEKVLKNQSPAGYFNNEKSNVNPWMHGVLVESLYDLWNVTGKTDNDLKKSIIRFSEWLRDSTWNKECACFPNGWVKKSGKYEFTNDDKTVNTLMIVDSMTIAYWLTGDKSFMDIADKAFYTGVHYPWGEYFIGFSNAKICAKQLRSAHRYIWEKSRK